MEDNDKNFEMEIASKRGKEALMKEEERVEDIENGIGYTDNSNQEDYGLNHDNQYSQNNEYGNMNGYQEVNEKEFMNSINWIINIHKIFGILGIIQGVLASLSIVGLVTGIPMIIASMKLMDTSKILFNYKKNPNFVWNSFYIKLFTCYYLFKNGSDDLILIRN